MKYLNILGYKYSLDMSMPLADLDGNVGTCDFNTKCLEIANDLDNDVIVSTIIHEIVEALNYHLELDLKHPQIMALEVGLHQVLIDAGVDLHPLIDSEKGVLNGSTGEHNGAVLFEIENSP